MTSELTGGFDLCIEYSEAVLAAILRPQIEPGPGAVNTTFGSGGAAVAGRVHLLIDTVNVSVQASGLTVTLAFFDSAFTVGSSSAGVASPLHGFVELSGVNCGVSPFMGTTAPTGPFFLTIDPQSPVTANVSWDPSSNDLVTRVMEAVGLTLADANVAIGRVGAGILASLNGPVTIGLPLFRIVSGDGSLYGPFSDIESVLLPAAGGRPGVAAILLNVLAASASTADKAAKTAIATAFSQLASFTVSPPALSSLFICPALVTALKLVPDKTNVTPQLAAQKLPPAYGTASGAPLGHELTLDHLDIAVEEGDISLKGHAAGHDIGPGDYWNVEASLAATITLSLVGGQVQAQGVAARPGVSVSVDWWKVALIGLFASGAVGVGAEEGVRKAVEDSTLKDVQSKLNDGVKSLASQFQPQGGTASGSTAPPNPLAAILTPQAIELHPTGLVLQGTPPALPGAPPLPAFPEAHFDITSSAGSVVDGPDQVAHDVGCEHRDYHYHVRTQQTEYSIKAVASNLLTPTTMRWTLGGRLLAEGQSTLRDQEGNAVVDYALTGASLWLRNPLNGDNFQLTLSAQISGADGLQATATTLIQFQGSLRIYEAAYYNDLRTCLQGLVASFSSEHSAALSQLSKDLGSIIGSRGGDPLGNWGATISQGANLVHLAGQDVPWLSAAAQEQAMPLRTIG